MTDPLFLDELTAPLPEVGTRFLLAGDEGRHAAVVRRIRPGEVIMIGDGRGRGIRASVVEVHPTGLIVKVADHLAAPEEPRRLVAAQALPKGEGSDWAVGL